MHISSSIILVNAGSFSQKDFSKSLLDTRKKFFSCSRDHENADAKKNRQKPVLSISWDLLLVSLGFSSKISSEFSSLTAESR
jgi:hypothetical protein